MYIGERLLYLSTWQKVADWGEIWGLNVSTELILISDFSFSRLSSSVWRGSNIYLPVLIVKTNIECVTHTQTRSRTLSLNRYFLILHNINRKILPGFKNRFWDSSERNGRIKHCPKLRFFSASWEYFFWNICKKFFLESISCHNSVLYKLNQIIKISVIQYLYPSIFRIGNVAVDKHLDAIQLFWAFLRSTPDQTKALSEGSALH